MNTVNTREGLNVFDLRKTFSSPSGERIDVLQGLSLSVEPGQSVAIIGASGSGKSTLLHLLGGLDEPDHGSIALAGHELVKLKATAAARFRQSRIAFVFQFHYLLSDLTTVENVAMPLLIQRRNQKEAMRTARTVLADLDLGNRADHLVTHLSGGEQQRVAVARALVTQPTLLLADEPTGNLDRAISHEITKTLTNYARTNRSMTVVATHDPHLANNCDRVFYLLDGRLREEPR